MAERPLIEPVFPEIYLGLVAPIGAPTNDLVAALEAELKRHHYIPRVIRLSSLLVKIDPTISSRADNRMGDLMERGNLLCSKYGDDAVARLAVHELMRIRRRERSRDKPGVPYLPRTAWILRSLKRPEEVTLFRRIYGPAYYTLALHTEYENRKRRLFFDLRAERPSLNDQGARDAAKLVIDRDEREAERIDHGQNVRRVFPMADVIIPGDDSLILEHEARRFVRILFGENITPAAGEHAMYLADATAALSASLSRKVGACVATPEGEVLALGCNEVPKVGGGQYGTTDLISRDKSLGVDYSTVSLQALVAQTLGILAGGGWLAEEQAGRADCDLDHLTFDAMELLKKGKSDVLGLIEFQRSVHAEVAAILDAGRRGVSCMSGLIYTTTYPCHLCAKEIVAAGITKVIYIEPYPKSRAESMYGAEIISKMKAPKVNFVPFVPFVGITPRAYRALFETEGLPKRDELGRVAERPLDAASPKVGILSPHLTGPQREREAELAPPLQL